MKIKTELVGVGVISLLLIFLVVSSFLYTSASIEEGNQAREFSTEVKNVVIELNFLMGDYLLHAENRAIEQWDVKYLAGAQLLKKESVIFSEQDPAIIELLGQINRNYVLMDSLFHEVVDNNYLSEVSEGDLSEQLQARLTTQLSIASRLVATSATALEKRTQEKVLRAQAVQRTITFIALGILAVALILILWKVSKDILQPLNKLTEANKLIIAGRYKSVQGKMSGNVPLEVEEFKKTRDLMLKGLVAKDELEKLNADLKEADRAKNLFLSMLSHDLKSPITPLLIEIQMLKAGTLGQINQKQAKSLATTESIVKYLNELISDVLDLASLQGGKLKANLEKGSFTSLVEDICSKVQPEIDQKNLVLVQDLSKIPEFYFSPKRLRQVVLNLLENSVKYTNKGSITISTAVKNSMLVVKVIDTGSGIKKANLKRIFAPYERVAGNEKTHGTGLGLAICHEVIKQHQGKIWATSQGLGKGTTITFTMPLYFSDKQA